MSTPLLIVLLTGLTLVASLQAQSVATGTNSERSTDRIVLTGLVLEALGLPLSNAQITVHAGTTPLPDQARTWNASSASHSVARRTHSAKRLTQTSTGSAGRYTLTLPAGAPVRVQISAAGHVSVQMELNTSTSQRLPDAILIRNATPLPEITVSANSPTAMARLPGASTVVGADVLGRTAVSVADALRTVPGVHTAEEDPFGLSLNIGMRGLPPRRSSRTLLLEDGMPILLGPYGDPSMHYAPPLEVLQRVELTKGSSQISNGPQTVGGVVNFVTRPPPQQASVAEVTMGAGARDLKNVALRLGAGSNGHGLALDAVHREGEGVRLEQSHRLQLASVNGVIQISPSQSLRIKLSHWNERSQTSETGLTQAEYSVSPHSLRLAEAGRFDVNRHAVQVVHAATVARMHFTTNAFASSTSRASWRQSGESQERLGEAGYAEDFNCAPLATTYQECGNQGRPRTYKLVGVEPRISTQFAQRNVTIAVSGGVRAYAELVRRQQYTGNAPASRERDATLTRDNTIDSRVLAGFAQARVQWRRLTMSPGVRIERIAQRNANEFTGQEASVQQRYTQLLPGVGATFAASPTLTVFGGIHRGFAPPRPADVYRPAPGQAVVLVDPETSMNTELGVRFAPAVGISLEATAFRLSFANEIIEAPALSGQRFINGGRTLHAGIEMGSLVRLPSVAVHAPDITLSASWMWLPTARFNEGGGRDASLVGNRLPYAPRQLLSSGVTFGLRQGFSIGTSVEHTGAQYADAENTVAPSGSGQRGILPAYSLVHAFASYDIPQSRVTLRASVRNVLDRTFITQRNEGIITGMRRLARAELHWRY